MSVTYPVILKKSDEGYSVGCPVLPGCWSQGATEAEALINIREAISEYLSVLREMNREDCLARFLTDFESVHLIHGGVMAGIFERGVPPTEHLLKNNPLCSSDAFADVAGSFEYAAGLIEIA